MKVMISVCMLAGVLAGAANAEAATLLAPSCTVSSVKYNFFYEGNPINSTLANVEGLLFSLTGCAGSTYSYTVEVGAARPELGPVKSGALSLFPRDVLKTWLELVFEAKARSLKVSVTGEGTGNVINRIANVSIL